MHDAGQRLEVLGMDALSVYLAELWTSQLMACCEHLQARGADEHAARLLAAVQERFSRHRAFQAALASRRAISSTSTSPSPGHQRG